MLQILKNDLFQPVAQDVLSIALDPIVEVDQETGVVFYDIKTNAASTLMGPSTVYQLVTAPKTFVGVRGATSDFSVAPKPGKRLRDMGGYTWFDDPLEPRQIEIVYDVRRCGGLGAWVEGEKPESKIDMPSYVMLLHEMRHAIQVLNGTFTWDEAAEESKAIEGENAFRTQAFLERRGGHGGGCKRTVGFYETYRDAGGGGGGRCFVATAAYGSELDPNVEFLRRFRDDVIRATRTGERFWDRYWERYQRLSPTVVEMIERDAELRELVRWSLVEPIVHYLELVQSFPDVSLADVPEPWASWLGEQRAKLAGWLGNIDLPTEFDGMEPDEVVSELAFLLRFVLRTPGARDEYVERLREHGALPLRVDDPTHERLAERLAATPATAERVDLILERNERPPILCAYGGQHVFSSADIDVGEWLYSVTVRNGTGDTFTRIVLFYKRVGQGGVVYWAHENVTPGEVVVFPLGVCNQMESYGFSGMIGDETVFVFPKTGHMTAAKATELNPSDTLRCADSWVIEP